MNQNLLKFFLLSQKEYAEELCRSSQEIQTVTHLTGKFYELIKNGQVESLKDWLMQAADSGTAELASFARRIKKDLAAVNAAIETQWNTGRRRTNQATENHQTSNVWTSKVRSVEGKSAGCSIIFS